MGNKREKGKRIESAKPQFTEKQFGFGQSKSVFLESQIMSRIYWNSVFRGR